MIKFNKTFIATIDRLKTKNKKLSKVLSNLACNPGGTKQKKTTKNQASVVQNRLLLDTWTWDQMVYPVLFTKRTRLTTFYSTQLPTKYIYRRLKY